jgi:hypothetical protein
MEFHPRDVGWRVDAIRWPRRISPTKEEQVDQDFAKGHDFMLRVYDTAEHRNPKKAGFHEGSPPVMLEN